MKFCIGSPPILGGVRGGKAADHRAMPCAVVVALSGLEEDDALGVLLVYLTIHFSLSIIH